MADKTIVAVVARVEKNGKHGPYAVAFAKNSPVKKPITFSLKKPHWKEVNFPEQGVMVILYDVQRKTAGWRAQGARYVRPEDAALVDEAVDEEKA